MKSIKIYSNAYSDEVGKKNMKNYKNQVLKVTQIIRYFRILTLYMMTEKCNWYVMYTAPRAEKKVSQRLQEKGTRVYLPMIEEIRQWSDRKKKVQRPLFNGYLFVYTSKERLWEALQISGAVKFINFSGEHAMVQQSEIDTIQRLIETGVAVEVETDDIEKGEQVRILGGALQGFEGECIQKSNQDYFIIRIPSINQSMLVKVSRKFLEVLK